MLLLAPQRPAALPAALVEVDIQLRAAATAAVAATQHPAAAAVVVAATTNLLRRAFAA